MRQITEEKYEAMFTKFQEDFKAAKLNIYYNMDQLHEELKGAAGAINEESGIAYPGGLLSHINLTSAIACEIATGKLASRLLGLSVETILKVILLQHLSKIEMFEVNDDEFQAKKRGYPFKFKETAVYLKAGERSILNAMNHGVKFTDEEFEAMKVLDNEDNEKRTTLSTLSYLVKSANEIAYSYERTRFKTEQK